MEGEFTPAPVWKTGLITSALTPQSRIIQFAVVDDNAIFEGDIILGTAAEVEGSLLVVSEAITQGGIAAGVVVPVERRWPGGTIPYEMPVDLGSRVSDAMTHWETHTCIRFVPRTTEPDYVVFRQVPANCSARVGKKAGGGPQDINLGPECSVGNVIHEIGHAVGLWHEQSREDRDLWVEIVWSNIDPFYTHNFDQHITDGDDVGAYDYASVMHYPRDAFSIDGSDTIIPRTTLPTGVTLGQRNGLSENDKGTVKAMYTGICPPELLSDAPEAAQFTP